jgi:co-chaperonin GroES (HSP10)
LRPLGDRVAVRLDPEEPKISPAGLTLPTHVQVFRTGTVVAVGPGCRLPTKNPEKSSVYVTEVKKGERVCFPSAVFHTRQGKQLAAKLGEEEGLINERDILFIIEKGNPRIE